MKLQQKTQFSLFYLFIALTVLFLIQGWLVAPRPVEIPMSKFMSLLREGKVDKVSLTEREVRGTLKPGALPAPVPGPGDRLRHLLGAEPGPVTFVTTRIPAMDDSALLKELEAAKIEYSGRVESTFWRDLLFGWVVPLGIMAGLCVFLMRRLGGGPTPAPAFGRPKGRSIHPQALEPTLAPSARAEPARARTDA